MLSRPDWEFAAWNLKRAANQWSTYATLALFQLIIVALIAHNHSQFVEGAGTFQRFPTAQLGNVVFTGLQFLNPLMLGLYALNIFGRTVSDYRTRGDASLILMTWHSPTSFFIGSIAHCIAKVAIVILMQVPFVVLMWTWGGVTLEFIITSYIVLISLLVFVAGITTFYSVISTGAAAAAAIIVAILMIVSPYLFKLINALLAYFKFVQTSDPIFISLRAFADWMPHFSVIYAYDQLLSGTLIGFDLAIYAVPYIGVGLLFFHVAKNRMNASFFRSSAQFITPAKTIVAKEKKPARPSRATVHINRPKKWPVAWKAFYFEMNGWTRVWISTALVLLYFVLCFTFYNLVTRKWAWWQENGIVVSTIFVFLILAFAGSLASSSNRWAYEKQNRTIINLCLTPIPMSTLMWHKFLAALPGVAPLLVSAFALLFFIQEGLRPWGWATIYVLTYFLVLFVTLSTLVCLMTRFGKHLVLFAAISLSFVAIYFMTWLGDPLARYYVNRFNVHLWGLGIGILFVLPTVVLSMRKIVQQMEIWAMEDVE